MINQILEKLKTRISEVLESLDVRDVEIIFETPKDASHGDISTNIAMRLAKQLKKSPIVIANEIVSKLNKDELTLEKAEVLSGFINFFLKKDVLANVVFKILEEGSNYGNLNIGFNENINLEFVSANPTGYLHIGHGRGAAYGDSLARVLKKAGFGVSTEHYVNDAGNQINNLALSIYERYKELFGHEVDFKEDYYHGKEIITIAKEIKDKINDEYLDGEHLNDIRTYGVNYLLNGLKKDLLDFNVEFDTWFSELSLYQNDEVNKTLNKLISEGHTYELDGAVWLKTTEMGDDKDRVLVKSDKTLTYLTPDIAYHANKLSRGYTHLINVLGADHHGYISRLKAAVAFVGGNADKIDVEILQMVRVLQNGEEVKMSKRSGKAITLRDLIDEVGSDALRFMYVSKALSTHMDLDLDLAVKNSNDNPVYYVQYAYARIASLFRVLNEQNKDFVLVSEFSEPVIKKAEKLLLRLSEYPMIIEEAATKRLPHKITQYLLNLSSELHSFYNDEKVITDNVGETNEKLTLLKAVQIVIKDGLNLIGVGVKERM